jgi:hypothetical protein
LQLVTLTVYNPFSATVTDLTWSINDTEESQMAIFATQPLSVSQYGNPTIGIVRSCCTFDDPTWKITFYWTSPDGKGPQIFVFPDDVSDGPWTVCTYGALYSTWQVNLS